MASRQCTQKSVPRGGVNSVASEGAPEYKFDEYDLPDVCVRLY